MKRRRENFRIITFEVHETFSVCTSTCIIIKTDQILVMPGVPMDKTGDMWTQQKCWLKGILTFNSKV